jgi:hypothetical protein
MGETFQAADSGQNDQIDDVYRRNSVLLDSLEAMEATDKRFRRRESFWRRGGPALALAPLAAAGVLVITTFEHNSKAEIDAAVVGVAGSLMLGLAGLYGIDKNREEGELLAVKAAPISYEINKTLQPWIAHRLAEKEITDKKRAER